MDAPERLSNSVIVCGNRRSQRETGFGPLPKLDVAGSNPVSRSKFRTVACWWTGLVDQGADDP